MDLNACVLDKLIAKTRSDENKLNNEDMFTLQELIHNCYSFMTAGYETTAHTITISFYHLATCETFSVQELLENSKLLKAHIKESLRLFPPVLQMGRQCMENTSIGEYMECAQYSRVQIDIVGMHYRRSIWGDDCEEFKPSRWLMEDIGVNDDKIYNIDADVEKNGDEHRKVEERERKIAAFSRAKRSWMPFGFGSKSCIGQSLAMMAVESVVSSFIQKFKLSRLHVTELQFTQTPTLRLKDMMLNVESIIMTASAPTSSNDYNDSDKVNDVSDGGTTEPLFTLV